MNAPDGEDLDTAMLARISELRDEINQLRITKDSWHAAYDDAVARGKDEYRRGFIAGLREYAWWKDGVQYVGSCGTTLKDAISRANSEIGLDT